jgi:hypothetical protein
MSPQHDPWLEWIPRYDRATLLAWVASLWSPLVVITIDDDEDSVA